jgi:hypothetical protein
MVDYQQALELKLVVNVALRQKPYMAARLARHEPNVA